MPEHDKPSPRVASALPFPTPIKKGQDLWWCSCGLSARQPFCDGSHKDTGFSPVRVNSSKDQIYFFCGCKHSSTGPLCDGRSHQQFTAQHPADDI
ncbi:MAG: CDGSH iron-sulfur domain-containing protein [Ketobacter sp.]|nr:CDGSH iron-sulfur domain-containing protein [Ketobacter sp.]